MKRSRRLVILLGLLLAACAATFGVIRYEEHKEVIRNSDAIVLEIDSDAVQTLSWEYGAETLAFHKEDTWLYDGDAAFPVDEEKIQERLELFRAFGVSFIIEDVEDYGQYGLDKPICTICLSTADEAWEILLGNYSSMDSQRYVSVGDGNVYLVQNDPLDYFDAGLSDMIDHDETPDFDKVTGIRFAGTESYSITYEEDSGNTYCEEDVYFAERAGSLLPLDTSRVDAYLQKISGLSLTDYVTYNATAEELDTLPGIGESLARRIIAYREANGPFGSIEEIMEVSGIGEAKFAELEDRVTVDNGKGEVTNEDSGG